MQNGFFKKVTYSYHNVNLKIYKAYFLTLPSPEIQVYQKEYLMQ